MNRYESTKKVSFLGIVGNVFLLIIKFIVALFSHSEAMMADAINSAGDIFSSIMSYIGNKIAGVPSDDDHNLGHGKAEYIFSMFISISMIVVSVKLLFDSISTLILGSNLQFSWFLIIVSVATILTKLCLYFYTKNAYKKCKNILLEANMKDHKNDMIITTFTLISVILSLFGIYFFDSVVGIGISIWICFTGVKIFVESYNVLMDISVDDKTKKDILDITHSFKEIKNVDDIISTPVGDKYLVFITIYLDGNMSTFESHTLANNLEKAVTKLDKIYKTVVHVEPV